MEGIYLKKINNFWERFFAFTLNVNPIFNLIAIIVLSIKRRDRFKLVKNDKFNLYTWGLLALSGFISILFAYDKGKAITSFIIPFGFIWLYILGRWYVKNPILFFKDVIRGTAFMSLLTIVFYFLNVKLVIGGVPLITNFHTRGRAFILGIGDNGLAALIQVGVVAALGLIFIANNKREILEYLLYFLLSIGALIITNSRGAMVGSAVSIALISIITSWKVITAFAGVTGFFLYIIPRFSQRVKSIIDIDKHLTRLNIYKGYFNMIKDHLWFGTGPGNFYDVYQKYRLPGDKLNARTPHSNYLNIITGWGIIGGLILYGWIFFIMLRAWFKGGSKYHKIIVAVLFSFWVHVLINDLFVVYSAVLLGCLDNDYFKKNKSQQE